MNLLCHCHCTFYANTKHEHHQKTENRKQRVRVSVHCVHDALLLNSRQMNDVVVRKSEESSALVSCTCLVLSFHNSNVTKTKGYNNSNHLPSISLTIFRYSSLSLSLSLADSPVWDRHLKSLNNGFRVTTNII